MRTCAVRVTVLAVSLLCAVGCSSDEAATTSPPPAGPSTAGATTTTNNNVTVRFEHDGNCNTLWLLDFQGRTWQSTVVYPASEMDRTGTVESVTGDTLVYRDDDGTVMTFTPGRIGGSNCS